MSSNSSLKPLVLHAHAGGPNPIKIAIALELLKIPYELKMWEFGDDAEKGVKGAAFLKINENGRVPALEDPNPSPAVVSWESGAVMNYIRRAYDKSNTLGPASDKAQDIVDFEKWEYFLLTTLGPMMGQLNWYRHYNGSDNPNATERYKAQSQRCFDILEAQLKKSGGKSVLGGERITAVDCHYLPWVGQHGYAQVDIEGYTNVKQWLERMNDLEEVKNAYGRIKKGQ